jgi:hypothetical protein
MHSHVQSVNRGIGVIFGTAVVLDQVTGPAYCCTALQVLDAPFALADVCHVVLLGVADLATQHETNHRQRSRAEQRDYGASGHFLSMVVGNGASVKSLYKIGAASANF